MARKFLLLFFFLQTSSLFAQTIDFTQVYHPIINEAELAIIDSSYEDALNFYKEAFSNVEKPFAKDFYNAAICAFYDDKQGLMFDYLAKLAEKDLPFDSLKNDKFFKLVIGSTDNWKNFEVRYKNTKPLINKALKDSLTQINRRLENAYKAIYKFENAKGYYFDTTKVSLKGFYHVSKILLEDKNLKDKNNKQTIILGGNLFDLNVIDKVLLDSLKEIGVIIKSGSLYRSQKKTLQKEIKNSAEILAKIVEEYGFPDENLIGLSPTAWQNNIAANILEEGDDSFWAKDISISRQDNFPDSTQRKIQNEIQLIFQAVRQGKLLPRTAQILLRNRTKNEGYHSGKMQIYQIKLDQNLACDELIWANKKDKWLYKTEEFSDFETTQINETRLKIGLESLNNCYKKLLFKQKDTDFEIHTGWLSKEYSYVSSCETAKKLVNNSTIIEN